MAVILFYVKDILQNMQKTLFVTVLLLSCSAVWAQQTKLKAELVKVFNDHTNVEYVTFNEKGSQIASGGQDNLIQINDLYNTTPTNNVLKGHTGLINDLKFINDDKQLLSASNDGTLKLWDIATQKELKSYANAPSYSLFKENYFLAVSPNQQFAYFGGKNAKVNKVDLNSVNITPKVVFASGFHMTCGTTTPDQKYLAIGCGKDIQLMDLTTEKIDYKVTYPNGFINDIQFSKNGKLMAAWSEGDGTIQFWEYPSLKPAGSIAAGYKSYCHIDFSKDDRWIASANKGNNFCIWDVATHKLLLEMPYHKAPITTLQFSPDGTQLLVGSHDGSVTLWKITTEEIQAPPAPPTPPAPPVVAAPPKPVPSPAPVVKQPTTNVVTKSTIKVANQDVILDVWDDEQEDGDVLSLVLNDQPLLENYKLIKLRKSIKIHLEAGITNLLIMHAIDLGKTPPNTAALSIYDGKRTRLVRLSSDFKDSQAIGIVYDPNAK
jgi:WD40 repeat protein